MFSMMRIGNKEYAVSPELLQNMQASIDAMKDPLQQASSQAHKDMLAEKLQKHNKMVEFKKAKYREGIEAMGKKHFENLVKEAGETIAKDVLRKKRRHIHAKGNSEI